MEKKQIKCPACGSYKTVDMRNMLFSIGGFFCVISFPLVITFFIFIFPVLLFGAGLIAFLAGAMVKNEERMKCNGCGFLFPKTEAKLEKDFKQRLKDYLKFKVK